MGKAGNGDIEDLLDRVTPETWASFWHPSAGRDDLAASVLRANLLTLLENTDDCILFSDRKGYPVFFNSNYARIVEEAFGIRMIPGLKPHRMLPEDQKDLWEGFHRRVLDGEDFRIEYSHTFPDGQIRCFEFHFRPIRIRGRIVGFSEISREITDLRQAETALRRTEEHLRSLMETATLYAVYGLRIDPDAAHGLRVVFVSPSIRQLMGVADPMDLESWFANLLPDDRERIRRANRQAFQTRGFDEVMRVRIPGTGKIRWIHAVSTAVSEQGGEPRFVNGILIDITNQKRIEEALSDRERQLEAESEKLREINVALRVLLKKREEDRTELEESVQANVTELIQPHLEKARARVSDPRAGLHLEILEENLKQISSRFARKLTSRLFRLTPAEIQVAYLVRQGYSSKKIALHLDISPKTVAVHRLNIRKKLRIAGQRVNLRTFLLNLD